MAKKKSSKTEDILCFDDDSGIVDSWSDYKEIIDDDYNHVVSNFSFVEEAKENNNENTSKFFSFESEEKSNKNEDSPSLIAADEYKETSIADKSRNDTVFNNFTVGAIEEHNEPFNCKRCYALRKSTVKMLNELKGFNVDVNLPIGEIVDDAIRYYYYFVTKRL